VSNLILNEGYKDGLNLFERGVKDKIYTKNRSFIDISNCAGSLLLGHNHRVFKNSIKEYSKNNFSIFSHPNNHAVKFSKSIKKKFNWFDKIVFCNTGSEAITKALRVCRSLNNKKFIVNATGSWHGSVDQFLFCPDAKLKNNALSDGLKKEDKKNLIFIPYNNLEMTKKILNKNKKNINCIFLEPIQGCLPLHDVQNYLKYLREFCNRNNVILVFDEMITGIRSYNHSIQKYFNVYSDITTLGKIIGGGLPIGVIGLSKKISQKISKKKVFFGGTFSGNSLSSYVGNELLNYISKNKKIITRLNKKSKYFQDKMNLFFYKEKLNLRIYRFASILRIIFTDSKVSDRQQRDFLESKSKNKINLFKKFLLKEKIYYASSGIIFFSHATSLKNVDYVIKKMKAGTIKYFNHKNI
jgi:glutamate-1-semialdehyde 2,1-aminomutase